MLHSICQQIWKTQQWPQDRKRSVFIPFPKKSNAKECSNYHTIAFISHASKVMLKILQARLQQYVNHELPDVQAGFRKGRGTRDVNTQPPDLPPEKSVCSSGSNRTGNGTTDWFPIGKGICQGCISSPCLFNLYAEYIMRNAGLDETQAGINIGISITSDTQMTSPL